MKTILVQVSSRIWTMEALHQACTLARKHHARVILLHLLPVTHASYLGRSFGPLSLTALQLDDLLEYEATLEDYGVEGVLQPVQAVTTWGAVADAAVELGADLVFAHFPSHRFTLWRQYQIRSLKARLQAYGIQLSCMEPGDVGMTTFDGIREAPPTTPVT